MVSKSWLNPWTPWLWLYGSLIYNYLCNSLIYNYLCNECLSPLMLRVQISIRAGCTTLCDKVCQLLVTGRWFSLGPSVSSTNKTDRHDITEIFFKVASNSINHKVSKLIIVLDTDVRLSLIDRRRHRWHKNQFQHFTG